MKGTRQAQRRGKGLRGLLPPLFMRFKLCHSRFSLRYSWWFRFYHMTNRYQKQGAIKIIIKIIITFVSFRFISSHFRGLQIKFSHLSTPLKNPLSGKGQTKTTILNLISAYFQATENTIFRTSNNLPVTRDNLPTTRDRHRLDYLGKIPQSGL